MWKQLLSHIVILEHKVYSGQLVNDWAAQANVRSSGKEEKEDPREVRSTKKQGKKREKSPLGFSSLLIHFPPLYT